MGPGLSTDIAFTYQKRLGGRLAVDGSMSKDARAHRADSRGIEERPGLTTRTALQTSTLDSAKSSSAMGAGIQSSDILQSELTFLGFARDTSS
jgi:hypothetical protein